MVVRIAGKRMYMWRAVDDEGEVLDMLVQRRRDTQAALRLMRKLLKKQGFAPKLLVTEYRELSARLTENRDDSAQARQARALIQHGKFGQAEAINDGVCTLCVDPRWPPQTTPQLTQPIDPKLHHERGR
jgi:transposase-like protein